MQFFNKETSLTLTNGLGTLSVNDDILLPYPAARIIAENGFNIKIIQVLV